MGELEPAQRRVLAEASAACGNAEPLVAHSDAEPRVDDAGGEGVRLQIESEADVVSGAASGRIAVGREEESVAAEDAQVQRRREPVAEIHLDGQAAAEEIAKGERVAGAVADDVSEGKAVGGAESEFRTCRYGPGADRRNGQCDGYGDCTHGRPGPSDPP